MDYASVEFSLNHFKIENLFRETNYKFYLLIEASSNAFEEQLHEQMLNLLDKMSDNYEDGILCDSET